mgnify:CR=1 FL=1
MFERIAFEEIFGISLSASEKLPVWMYKVAAFSKCSPFSNNFAASLNCLTCSQTPASSIISYLSLNSCAMFTPLFVSPVLIDVQAIPA